MYTCSNHHTYSTLLGTNRAYIFSQHLLNHHLILSQVKYTIPQGLVIRYVFSEVIHCVCKRTLFQGEIVNGEYHGEGTYTWPDGSYFSGPFLHNK